MPIKEKYTIKDRNWARLYARKPEIRAKRKHYMKDYILRPGIEEKRKEARRRYMNKLYEDPLFREKRKAYRQRPEIKEATRLRAKIYNNTPWGKFVIYKKNAQRTKRVFTLQFEEFEKIINLPCHYCGKIAPSGIDRKNNNEGYISENSLPCCWDCNFAKRSTEYESFIRICIKISNKHRDLF